MFRWIASIFASKKIVSSERVSAFQGQEPDLDLRGVICGVGAAGVAAEQDVLNGVRAEGILRTDGFDDPEFEPAFLFVIGTVEDLWQDSEKAAIWRNRAWCHFALVLDKEFDLNDSDLKVLAERYDSVIPLIGVGAGSVIEAATAIVHANLEVFIKQGIVCVDYADMATVLKYMGGILYAQVATYVPPEKYGPVMVESLRSDRNLSLLPLVTGVVSTSIADINFAMIDFDEHMNALRDLVNESAIIVGGGPHGVYELSEHEPGMSVMLCSFAEYNAERFKKDRGQ